MVTIDVDPQEIIIRMCILSPISKQLGRVLDRVRAELIKEAVLIGMIDVDSPDNVDINDTIVTSTSLADPPVSQPDYTIYSDEQEETDNVHTLEEDECNSGMVSSQVHYQHNQQEYHQH